jgi:predicted naringenin-chalcone synthase
MIWAQAVIKRQSANTGMSQHIARLPVAAGLTCCGMCCQLAGHVQCSFASPLHHKQAACVALCHLSCSVNVSSKSKFADTAPQVSASMTGKSHDT